MRTTAHVHDYRLIYLVCNAEQNLPCTEVDRGGRGSTPHDSWEAPIMPWAAINAVTQAARPARVRRQDPSSNRPPLSSRTYPQQSKMPIEENRRRDASVAIGDTVLAHPLSVRQIIIGVIVEIEGRVASIETDTRLVIAVEIADCVRLTVGANGLPGTAH
ncbi:MAG: hypothetical protein ACR2KJ_01350 [Jatrophihabitans sp.]